MYLCLSTYISTYIHVHTYVIRTYIHVHTYVIHTHTHTNITCTLRTCKLLDVCTCIYLPSYLMYVPVPIYLHMYIHTCTYIRNTHTHTHTNITCTLRTCKLLDVCTCIYLPSYLMYVPVPIYLHTYIHTCTYIRNTYIHTYMYIHT